MITHIEIFVFTVLILLTFDLGLFSKAGRIMKFRDSLLLSLFYISAGLLFGVYIFYEMGSTAAHEYYAGFVLEKTMSLDNIFVISMIFKFFSIPGKYQHRILFWGIIGVIVLRALMIFLGISIIEKFSWTLYILGGVLIFTGIKGFFINDESKFNIKEMWIYKYLSKHFNIYEKTDTEKFFVRTPSGELAMTPLFMALILIEFMDLVFAIDSLPVIFAITQNSFIIYTSNIFAILGLRALFFLLAQVTEKFKLVKYSLALILVLIGIKILASEFVEVPKFLPLIMITVILSFGVGLSIVVDRNKSKQTELD